MTNYPPNFNYYPPPQAPQPGVIPLRPLDVGAVLNGSFQAIFRNWQAALLLPFGVYAVVAVVDGLLVIKPIRGMSVAFDSNNAPSSGTIRDLIVVIVVTIVLTVLSTAIVQTTATLVVSRAVLGRRTSIGQALRAALPRILPIVGLNVLIGLLIAAFFLLPLGSIGGAIGLGVAGNDDGAFLFGCLAFALFLAAAAFAIYFGNGFTVAGAALILESIPARAAMRRSRGLVRDFWWRTFGIMLLAGLIANLASSVVQLPASAIRLPSNSNQDLNQALDAALTPGVLVLSVVVSSVALGFTQQFLTGISTLLYHDLRIRKEGFQVPLFQMAQLPDDLNSGPVGWRAPFQD
ncbi:hypothetical protein [Kribbella sp. NPDC055071]